MKTATTIDIPIDLIKVKNPIHFDKDDERNQMFLVGMTQVGLLNPIDVRVTGGNYELACGRKRLWAAKVLKWTTIPATIGEWNNNEIEFVRTVENLHRKQLSAAEQAKANKALLAEFERAFGPDPGRAAGGHARASTATRGATASESKYANKTGFTHSPVDQRPAINTMLIAGLSAEPDEATVETTEENGAETATETASETEAETKPKPKVKSFSRTMGDITGKHINNVIVDIKVAKAFSEDQLNALALREVTRSDLVKIAGVDDVEQRAKVVNLVCIGKTVDEALASVSPPANSIEAPKPKVVDKPPKKDSGLSDFEWLDLYCAGLTSKIQDPASYRSQAIYYRAIISSLGIFRRDTEDASKRAKEQGAVFGPLSALMGRVFALSHPSQWYLCASCQGRNIDKPRCEDCKGNGFKLRHEYLAKK